MGNPSLNAELSYLPHWFEIVGKEQAFLKLTP